jgi:hypothetical protein
MQWRFAKNNQGFLFDMHQRLRMDTGEQMQCTNGPGNLSSARFEYALD